MKEKLTRNISLKILSVILAAILWLVITNVDDPVTAVNFNNFKVDILHAEEISALDQVYNITEGATIDFTAAARRSVADKLSKEDFRVTADLSKLSDLNTVTINIKYLGNQNDVTITNGANQVMKVELEDLVDKHFRVTVQQTGELGEGLYVYEKTASTILKITGPKSKIEKIAEVSVFVDVTGYTKSFSTMETPKALDENGKEIDGTNLTFSKTSIPVNVGMYNTKQISLNITTTGKPRDGYTVASVDYEPKTIEIAAEDTVLSGINAINVTENIDGVYEDVEKEVNIQEQLPEGVVLVGDNKTAVVNIAIERAVTKDFAILPSDLEIRNKPLGTNLEFLSTGPILIRLSGPKDEIDDITVDNMAPYIDLTDYSHGSHYVAIEADFAGYTTVINSPTININLN